MGYALPRVVAVFLSWALLAGCSSLIPVPTPTLSALEISGRGVFVSYCSRCHATSGETVVVGPSLARLATEGGNRLEGVDAATYIRNSIVDPDAYVVEGFPEGIMPLDLRDQLSPQDLDAIVAYLLTLK